MLVMSTNMSTNQTNHNAKVLNPKVDRTELNLDQAWAETGDRYMLKLFRDYIFHQVTIQCNFWNFLIIYFLVTVGNFPKHTLCCARWWRMEDPFWTWPMSLLAWTGWTPVFPTRWVVIHKNFVIFIFWGEKATKGTQQSWSRSVWCRGMN